MQTSGRLLVRLHFYEMESTPRSNWGRDYLRRYYRGTDDLLNKSLDGIIVTGAEPKAARLTEEPYWATFCPGHQLGPREYHLVGVLLFGRSRSRPAYWRYNEATA
jgi:Homoserine O-succinyltransferase